MISMFSIYMLEAGLLNIMCIIYNLASMHVNDTIYTMYSFYKLDLGYQEFLLYPN